jgi:hypothetical protein
MNKMSKKPIHKLVSGGKVRQTSGRFIAAKQSKKITVLLASRILGTHRKKFEAVNITNQAGEKVSVLDGLTVALDKISNGRKLVSVLNRENELVSSRVIERSIDGIGFNRHREPITVNLSPNLNWCNKCGRYTSSKHKC